MGGLTGHHGGSAPGRRCCTDSGADGRADQRTGKDADRRQGTDQCALAGTDAAARHRPLSPRITAGGGAEQDGGQDQIFRHLKKSLFERCDDSNTHRRGAFGVAKLWS